MAWRVGDGRRAGVAGPLLAAAAACMVLAWGGAAAEGAESISFRHDVMGVISKAGCNAGGCHGLTGTGEFNLSLWGDWPEQDYEALTREQLGRRTDRVDPDNSLILRKATGAIPHGGGQRFEKDSPEYRILREWIAAGTPADDEDALPELVELRVSPSQKVIAEPEDRVQLRVEAAFSDGTVRDVTEMAVYEPADLSATVSYGGEVRRQAMGDATILVRYLNLQEPVRLSFIPERADFAWSDPPAHNYIDEHVYAKLRSVRTNPSELADDHVFVRRAYLDIVGVPPSPEEARAFVEDGSLSKRERLVERLVERPEFADHWALKWADLLRNEENVLDTKGVAHFHAWIRSAIEDGMPTDRFVRELLTGRGSTYANPPANFYRALREPKLRAEAVAQVFLGTRLSCAQCHSHPFEPLTQDDYYGFAALFARVDYKVIENNRRDRFDQNQFIGEQVVYSRREGELRDPRDNREVAPRFLRGGPVKLRPGEDRLEALAAWVTGPDNRQFARVMVNRVWSHMLGRGVVEPVDDFRPTNPPSIPGLLDDLADDFVEHGYDLRHLVRRIAASRTYQLSSIPNETNRDDEVNFARAKVRRLSAEQLVDAVSAAAGAPTRFNGYPPGMRAAEMPGVRKVFRDRNPSPGDVFLRLFGKPERLLSSDSERTEETTLGQAFELISGPMIDDLLSWEGNRIDRLLAAGESEGRILDELYWAALARPAGDEEREALLAYVAEAEDRRAALQDIVWGLLNAKAFLLRH